MSYIQQLGQQLGTQAAGGLLGAGMGLLLEGHNDRRQIRQQQKLTDMQSLANQQQALFNYEQQMKMWKETNYAAQMEQLKRAGLNPGLLYGISGGGGATTNAAQASGVNTGQAPSGGGEIIGLAMQQMQLGLMSAQRANIEADTMNKQADTANKPIQGKNIEANTLLTQTQTQWEKIRTNIAEATKYEAIGIIIEQMKKTALEVENMVQTNKITRDTAKDQIKIAHQQAIGAVIENELKDTQIAKNKAEIDQIANAIEQKWTELELQNRHLDIEEFRNIIQANMPTLGQIAGGMLNSIKAKIDEILGLNKRYIRPNQIR